jgi:hypothetical protein
MSQSVALSRHRIRVISRQIVGVFIATVVLCFPRLLTAQVQSGAASSPANAAAGAAAASPATEPEGADLAKKLNNPISDLVSVPFQFNWQNGIGPKDQTQYILNIQPVMPFSVTEDMNLIVRVIAPIVSQPPVGTGGLAASGVADVLASFFLSPKRGSITWGVGPVISLPSTNVPTLGTQKWSAGPTGVALKQKNGWTVGTLVNQIWSFAGQTDRRTVNQMFLQPVVVYTTAKLWSFTANSESTADWKVESPNRWTVPVNLAFSKLSSFGTFPASYQFGWGYFVKKPVDGPTWKVRATITILMPKKK